MLSKITLTNKSGFDEILITEGSGTRVFKRDLAGDFSSQRNFALSKAKGDWVLFLDSDETFPRNLENLPAGYDAFRLKRTDTFLGRKLRHGETGNIKLLRLARRTFGTWQGKVHEVWVGNGVVGELNEPILHAPHPSIAKFISKINFYTSLRAKELPKFSLFETILKPPLKFIDNYFLKLGFLDGRPGFVMAYMMSLHSLIVRVKQYEEQNS